MAEEKNEEPMKNPLQAEADIAGRVGYLVDGLTRGEFKIIDLSQEEKDKLPKPQQRVYEQLFNIVRDNDDLQKVNGYRADLYPMFDAVYGSSHSPDALKALEQWTVIPLKTPPIVR